MVSPYKHQSKFDLLCDKTQIEMMSSISHLMKIMRKRMNVDGFNFGANFIIDLLFLLITPNCVIFSLSFAV